jgi:hypothetical protein
VSVGGPAQQDRHGIGKLGNVLCGHLECVHGACRFVDSKGAGLARDGRFVGGLEAFGRHDEQPSE